MFIDGLKMRSNRFYFITAATLMLVFFGLSVRRVQIKHALQDSAVGLYEHFHKASSDDDGVVIEHTGTADPIAPVRIGMVTMLIGDSNPTFERALKTHMRHGQMQGYETFVMRSNVLDMMYNKPMFILNILMDEMKKPYHQRLQWLL